jgi:hypothetical protein
LFFSPSERTIVTTFGAGEAAAGAVVAEVVGGGSVPAGEEDGTGLGAGPDEQLTPSPETITPSITLRT